MYNGDNTQSMRVAFYIRVSTEEQKKDGYGPEMQMQGLEDMITYRGKIHGWTHKKEWEYKDLGCTGADLNRPEFKRMMQDAKDGKFDMIAVWKIDRLSRNLSHLLGTFEILQKNKVGFFSHKENIDFTGPIGKLTFQIFGALAEFERETIKTRTKEGKMTSARLGNYVLNNTPFGYKKEDAEKKRNRSLTIIKEEAEWVKRIFKEFVDGASLTQIANILNEGKVLKNDANLKKNKMTRWYSSTVGKILESSVYIGRAVYNSKDDAGNIEAIEIVTPRIIPDILFELAKKRLSTLSDDVKRGGGSNEYLLSRKITNVASGKKFVGVSRSKDKQVSYRHKAFTAPNGKVYKNLEIPGKAIEKLVWDTVYKRVNRPGELFEVFKKQSVDSHEYDALMKERDINQREIDRLEKKEEGIEMDYYDGKLSEERKDKLINTTLQQRQAKEVRNLELDNKLDAIIKAEETKIAFSKFESDFETNLENLTFEQKKLLIDMLIESIEVTTVASQLNVQIKVRFDQTKIGENGSEYEPKNPTTKPKDGSDGIDSDVYGGSSRVRQDPVVV